MIEAIKLYQSGLSTVKIAKLYNVNPTTVCRFLKKNGIILKKTPSKYAINENLFDNIDSEEKAYLLGFLWADGTVNKNAFVITLHNKDEEILHKFAKIIYKENYYISKVRQCKRLCVTNKVLSDRLKELGCVQNKTHILEFPRWLDKSLYKHFIRGMFDGDGCIYSSNKYKTTIVDYTGSVLLCEALIIILKEIGINKVYRYKRKKQCETIMSFKIQQKNLVKLFLDYIYKGAIISLKRKHEKYLKLISKEPYDTIYN